jgi:hypothetical protein
MEQNMQFMSRGDAPKFVMLCMGELAAANPAREQQGPAAHA